MNRKNMHIGYTDEQIQFFNKMKAKIRFEMKNVFKIPDCAFAEMDFNGRGYIEEDDFFHTLLNYKLPYSKDEIKEFFKFEKLFIRAPDGKMNFEAFKKAFFPKRCAGDDDEEYEEFKLENNLDEK